MVKKHLRWMYLFLAASTTAPAFAASVQIPNTFSDAIALSNGDKMVTGPFNTLHTVYTEGSTIYYITSANGGTSWTGRLIVNSTGAGQNPAIAVDSQGHVGVVWIGGTQSSGPLFYASMTMGTSGSWVTSQLAPSALEPAIVARGTQMYVTWSTDHAVQYASFPSVAVPTPITPEVIASTTCPASGFRKPAITLIASPCKPPVPRVAYLYYAQGQTGPNACQNGASVIGPVVRQRDSSTQWPQVYGNPRTDPSTSSTVTAVSLSLSAHYDSGDTFLAWSDEQSGNARTVLAHGHGGTWDASLFKSSRQHVHVRADPAAPTQFRLAWIAPGWLDDNFFGPSPYSNTGTWTGTSPTWSGSVPLNSLTPSGGWPQAVFWKACSAGQLSTVNAYYAVLGPCGDSRWLAIDKATVSPCPGNPKPQLGGVLCDEPAPVAVGRLPLSGKLATAVDFSQLGVITEVADSFVRVTTPDGKEVTITWGDGTLVDSWDGGFRITAPPESLRFEGGEGFKIEDLGSWDEYDKTEISAEPAKSLLKCL